MAPNLATATPPPRTPRRPQGWPTAYDGAMSAATWERFEHDPRLPAAARLRASDRDRDVALEVLGQAFADGRLDHAEHDERSTSVTQAKVLGDLVPLLDDLVPTTAVALRDPAALTEAGIRDQAVRRWAKDRREALSGFVGVSAITWTIWAVVMWGGFPWPLFPMLAALVNLMRIQLQKQDIVDDHVASLRKREAKALRKREAEAGGSPEADD
jgi:hypothetical protein